MAGWASPLRLPLPSSEVTHVVMEQTSAEEAVCWQERRAVPPEAGCARPTLLDISWFTESMAAGQPVPVECRHRLQVRGVGGTEGAPAQVAQLGQVRPVPVCLSVCVMRALSALIPLLSQAIPASAGTISANSLRVHLR